VVVVLRRVQVEAADHVVVGGVEHREREAGPIGEVAGVAFEVTEVLLQWHLVRPVPVREPRGRPDVVHARRPGGVVALVVLGPERLEDEPVGREPPGRVEVVGDEGHGSHASG